jgi:hypothetical protein
MEPTTPTRNQPRSRPDRDHRAPRVAATCPRFARKGGASAADPRLVRWTTMCIRLAPSARRRLRHSKAAVREGWPAHLLLLARARPTAGRHWRLQTDDALAAYATARHQEIRVLDRKHVLELAAIELAGDEEGRMPGGSWRIVPRVKPAGTFLRGAWIPPGRPAVGKVRPARYSRALREWWRLVTCRSVSTSGGRRSGFSRLGSTKRGTPRRPG